MKQFLKKKKYRLHFILIIISLLISVLSYLLITNLTEPYKLNLNNRSPSAPEKFNIYYDLDRDGSTELYTFGKHENSGVYYVVSRNNNGTYREQFNFFNKTFTENIFHFDLNDDFFDELIIFSKSDSVLCVSVIDLRNDKFIVREKAILNRPKKVQTKFWDLDGLYVTFNDIDKDGIYEMYICPVTGHAIYPRGLFVFDTQNFSLINKFETTAPIKKIIFTDFNNDGYDELIIRTRSYGNTHDYTGFHDQTNWLILLDKDLKILKKPLQFGEFLTSITIDLIEKNGVKYILVVFRNKTTAIPVDYFALYDFDLNMRDQQKLPGQKINDVYLPNKFSKFFIASFESGEIAKFNLEFRKLKSVKIKSGSYKFHSIIDVCEEPGDEIILNNSSKIILLSQNLELIQQKEFNATIQQISVKYNLGSPDRKLLIATEDFDYLFSVDQNYLLQFGIFLIVPLFLLSFLMTLIIFKAFSNVSRIFGAYNYSYDDTNIGMIVTDHCGRIKTYNKSIFYNLPPDTNIKRNKSIFDVFNQTKEFTTLLERAFKIEKEVSSKLTINKTNYKFIGSISIHPLFSLFKIPHAFVIKIQNKTQELEKDRTAVWSRISQKIAHDIKTPLSTIQLNLSALKSRIAKSSLEEKENVNDDIDMIQQEIHQIKELTKSFLKFSSLEKPKFQWIDTKELIKTSKKPFNKYFEDGIKFELEIQDDINSIWVDPNQMVQLFHILFENSIDAIGQEGNLKIGISIVEDLQHKNQSYVEILLTDNGRGISEESINKIFDPYFTQKRDGTGMGLTIAKKIIDDHNGTIEVKSRERLGTTITIRLPNKN